MTRPRRAAPASPRSAPGSRLVLLACFVSGAAGLIFETVWFHRSGLVFGNSVWSTSLVLSSFMGGLAVGSAVVGTNGHRLVRFLRAYAAVEVVVAVFGVALTHALPGLTDAVVSLTRPESDRLLVTNVVRFLTAFGVLLVPSSAMGATLPLLVAWLAPWRAGFGQALGQVYGWNTLGAVVGVVGAEVWLIGAFGVAGSAWAAAALSLGAAACAGWLSRGEGLVHPPRAQTTGDAQTSQSGGFDGPIRGRILLACSFLSGGALLALEIVWFRFLTLYVLSTTLAASLMLAAVLAAIGLGGLSASAWLKRQPHASQYLPVVAFAAGCSVVASYAAFQALTEGTQIAAWHRILWLASALTLPTSWLSGAFFTVLGHALQREVGVETRTAGWLTLANTAGGMCGPLVAAFVMLPTLGTERAFFAIAVTYLAIGILAIGADRSAGSRWRSPVFVVSATSIVIALAVFPFGLMNDVYAKRIAQPYARDGSSIVATREGPSETIFLMQQKWMDEPIYTRLVTNGFSMSGTALSAVRYMRYFVYWPLVLHRGPLKHVLVVCYGVGVTAGAALDLPAVESIDVAEISPDIVAMSDLIYPSKHPLHDPRVRLHLEDGRQLLETTTKRFDLITGEPPPPRTPGAVNIYTREYFQLTRDRLAAGGIATYWLPVGRPDPGTNVGAILRAFCDVFDDCSLWNATPFDLMLVGTRGAAGPVPVAEFVQPWQSPDLRARLSEVGLEVPQQVGATFLGDSAFLRQLTADTPPLVDDRPQRLLPDRKRPSLSDPGYGVDPEVTKLYETVMDPMRARRAFASSAFVGRLWSTPLIEETLPFFDQQRILNTVFWEGGRPLRRIENLHSLLTETPLRTLPLWLLGSDAVRERIASHATDQSGAVDYARGLSALAARDYFGAAASLADAERRGLRNDTIQPLRVYALCLAGRLDAAREVALGVRPRGDEERHFWEWLGPRFGVGPFGGG